MYKVICVRFLQSGSFDVFTVAIVSSESDCIKLIHQLNSVNEDDDLCYRYVLIEKDSVKISDVQLMSVYYRVSGDLKNGSCVCHEDVVRRVRYITSDEVVLECGRRFIINDNLSISEF